MAAGNKAAALFYCRECGYESRKWMGQCPSCHNWNSFTEEPAVRNTAGKNVSALYPPAEPMVMADIPEDGEVRFETGFSELSRVLGGGIVPGSLILVGGDPGIGKSTLLLQMAANLAGSGKNVLYISGEESLRQIRLRAQRLGCVGSTVRFLSENRLDVVTEVIERLKPELCIIDSIQTMYSDAAQSAPGSVVQVRECAQRLMVTAKSSGPAIVLVGHVTKEGTVAGPRVLEHIVDTVLYFESGEHGSYRILRSAKNRFGSTNEIGVFEMCDIGLKEILNPSAIMLSGRPEGQSGAVVTCLIEGTRPMLFEVQGLLCETSFNLARRQTSGMDYNRLNLLLAVLEKRCGFKSGLYDAYVNIAGGMKVSEPASDLAVIAAIISSYKNTPVSSDTIVFGEVGLSGEVRAVSQAQERLKEAQKLGFKRVIMPKPDFSGVEQPDGLELVGVRYIRELFDLL